MIESAPLFSNITFSKEPLGEYLYYLNCLMVKEEYEASFFIIIQNKEKKEQKYYYSYTFNIKIEEKTDDEDHTYKIIIILIAVFIFIIIILYLFTKFISIMKKNKELEEKVRTISFSADNNTNEGFEDREDKRNNFNVSFI